MTSSEQKIEDEIQAKGLNAPRLNPQMIDDTIVGEFYLQTKAHGFDNLDNSISPNFEVPKVLEAVDCLTVCILVLRNGFTIVGKSACASPANFDAELGKKIAREDARRQIWALEGYALRNVLAAA